jgi:2-polyprenyl-3-methyl-5-hydroxy-6-metoxy-1,4-benzoquinol methylase
MTTQRNHGTGPGPITPDGCAVDYYATLTPNGEPERIHAAIPERATILELGAGAGSITHRLTALGHQVVAVDESPEMLAHIRDTPRRSAHRSNPWSSTGHSTSSCSCRS